jgi:hypothetical protein
MRRLLTGLLFGLLVLTACAAPGTGGPGGVDEIEAELRAEFERRGAEVATAWAASPAAAAWRDGFVPLQDLTVLPAGDHSEEIKQAALGGWYATALDLDRERPAAGEVVFDDGTTLAVPVAAPAEAWEAIHQGEPDCPSPPPPAPGPDSDPDTPTSDQPVPCIVLNVTGVEAGTVTVMTSRGPARAPAWLFQVAQLDEPVARVAVAPEAVVEVPRPPMPTYPYQPGLANAFDLTAVDGVELGYRVGVGACDETPEPLLYETADVVVVGGSTRTRAGVTACTDQLLLEPVTVTLAAPLGGRPVLSAAGEPLTYAAVPG